MKKFAITSLALVFLLSVCSAQALAGSKQRHRWEGVAIGVGATLLGAALLNQHAPQGRAWGSATVSNPHRASDRFSRNARYRQHRQGRWETRKVWVEPVIERVWNPAHYNRAGRWVQGRWITVERSPGYWKEERIWVSCR